MGYVTNSMLVEPHGPLTARTSILLAVGVVVGFSFQYSTIHVKTLRYSQIYLGLIIC
jgi:hypothetical protein